MKKIILSLSLIGALYACSSESSTTVEVKDTKEVVEKETGKKFFQKPEETPLTGLDELMKAVEGDGSVIQWEGYKPTGTHVGNLALAEKTIVIKNDELKSIELKFDMNSISCTDITSPDYNKKLINHLRSDDFFNVENYPQAILKSTEIVKGNGNYKVKADLTIKGITQTVVVPVSIKQVENMNMLVGGLEIDRTKFNIHYKSKSIFPDLGDKFISDNFTVKFAIAQNK